MHREHSARVCLQCIAKRGAAAYGGVLPAHSHVLAKPLQLHKAPQPSCLRPAWLSSCSRAVLMICLAAAVCQHLMPSLRVMLRDGHAAHLEPCNRSRVFAQSPNSASFVHGG